MSKKDFPQGVLMQPDFHPANWKRPSVSEEGFPSSLRDSQESESESLVQERWYQLELQQRIHENEELVGLYSDELENDSLEEDSLEEMSLKEQEGAAYDTNRYTNGIQKNDGRKEQSVDKYFSLRYNPNWKNTEERAEFSEAEKASQIAGGSSVDFSQDSFYLHSSGFPEEKNQQEAKSQDSFSEFGTELLNFHEPSAVISNELFRLCIKGKESSDGCHLKDSPSTCGSAFSLQIQEDRPQRAKKDFVEKNKRTLGLRSEKINSYLQLHNKKQEVLQEQSHSSKAYINLNVKLGGLGPDYEAIKEKALEYAKKIPRPKTFMARQSDEEVKEERVLPQTLNGDSLPQIASLETLQNRHEKEKQVVAAFRTLHIL
ncbi:jhy protein [Grus japonensis]|uniref:Jhy protein n=1 Tax=Grus japonensis TaxID=30415 RepID=A0ABC9XPZ2_GRUJA